VDCRKKCDPEGASRNIDTIVVHATDYEDWDSSVAHLRDDLGKSVHYLVGRDGRIVQFMPERYVAWHAGNYPVNLRSIGIEHVGSIARPFTEIEYAASVRLVAYLVNKYGIAPDREHIIGHYQVPDPTALDANAPPCAEPTPSCESDDRYGGIHHHRDPGPLWDWDGYLARIAQRVRETAFAPDR